MGRRFNRLDFCQHSFLALADLRALISRLTHGDIYKLYPALRSEYVQIRSAEFQSLAV